MGTSPLFFEVARLIERFVNSRTVRATFSSRMITALLFVAKIFHAISMKKKERGGWGKQRRNIFDREGRGGQI